MKWLKRIGLILMISLAAVAALAWFLVATETGTRQTLRMVSPWLPDGLEPGQWSGTLAGPLRIDRLRYDSDAMVVSVAEATLAWAPARLLAGELAVHELTATGVDIELKPTETPVDKAPWRPSDIRLGFDVAVERATVRSLSIQPADPAADPIVIDEATVTAAMDADGVRLERLSVVGSPLSIDGTARLDPRGNWPAAVDARLTYRPTGLSPLTVAVDARGNLERLDLVVSADAPWSVNVEGSLSSLAETPGVDLTVTVSETSLSALDPAWPALRVAGRARVTGNEASARLDGEASLIAPGLPPFAVAAKASGNRAQIAVESLSLRAAQSTVTTSGTIALPASGPTVAMTGQWSALRWPLADDPAFISSKSGTVRVNGGTDRLDVEIGAGVGGGRLDLGGAVDLTAASPAFDVQGRWTNLATSAPPLLASPEGTLSLKGTVDAYDIVLDTRLAAAPWAQGRAELRASGDRFGLNVQNLDVPVTGGRLQGKGTVSWRDGLDAAADVSIRAFDPGSIWPAAPGRIDAVAAVSAAFSDTGRRASLHVTRLGGTLLEAPVTGRATVVLTDNTLDVQEMALNLAGNALTVTGTVGAGTDLGWQLDAPDLSLIGKDLKGVVTSTGRIAGAAGRLAIEADLQAEGVQSGPVLVQKAVGRVVVGDKPGDALAFRIDAQGLRIGEREVSTLLLEADGTTGEHSGRVALRSEFGGLSARLAGGYTRGAWSGNLDALRAEPVTKDSVWVLDRAAALTLSPDAFGLKETCLVQAGASVCAKVQWNRGGIGDMDARVARLAIQDFSPWLPPALDYAGTLSGTVSLAGGPTSVTGDAEFKLSPGTVRQKDRADDDDPPLLAWREANISAALTHRELSVRSGFDLVNAGRLNLELAVPMAGLRPDPDGPLTGNLNATLTEVPLIETLIPDIDQLRGRVAVDMAVAGTLSTPRVTGSARLTDASAELPRLGLALADTRLAVSAAGNQLSLDGAARSGDGQVAISGEFRLDDGRWRGRGTLKGDRFTAVSLPELSAILSPDLSVSVDHRSLLLEGEVLVPSARIEPRDLQGTVQASPDAVIVDDSGAPGTKEPWQVTSRVRIALGDDVRIDAFGLEGNIRGSLVAEDRPGKPSKGTGELSVLNATITAYSQKLDVERGRLIFTGGPLSSPGVDIRATRAVDDIVVGVDLRGQLARPEATLFSIPAMNQTEALSYLVLGRPLSTVSSSDQGVLGQASMRLGFTGAEYLAQEVGRRIGLDAVELRATDDQSQTALVVGKYLSPRLYVSYGLGLFDAFNSVLVRYTITDDLSVQTETGSEISADVFYTRER